MTTRYEELTTGPLANEIAPHIETNNDGAIEAIMYREDIPQIGFITIDDFSVWATMAKMRSAIKDHAENTASPLRDIALTLQDFLGKPKDTAIDFSNPDNILMLNIWVVAGELSLPLRDALLAKATHLISRSEQIGKSMFAADVSIALRGNAEYNVGEY